MEHTRAMLRNQFGAAINMLRNAITQRPEKLWDDRSSGVPFWHLAYHTLFYMDLCLSESEETVRPAAFHRENSNFLRDLPSPPHVTMTPIEAYHRAQLLEYLDCCREKCFLELADLAEEKCREKTWFPWLDFSVGDLMLYNMRHVEHHTGQLNLILQRRTGSAPGWVGCRTGQGDSIVRGRTETGVEEAEAPP